MYLPAAPLRVAPTALLATRGSTTQVPGPDLAKAARLAKESGTTGIPVTVWGFNAGPDKAVGAYLVRLLQHLKATLVDTLRR